MSSTLHATSDDATLLAFLDVRRRTQQLAAPLCVEDQVIQSMPDASPTKWHLAHTTWFFERFILSEHLPGYMPVNEQYFYLFNSYYNTVGPMHQRPHRGLLSRPTVREIEDYRAAIDQRMMDWLDHTRLTQDQLFLLNLGMHHEQQHQELILTDIKHALAQSPLLPAYTQLPSAPSEASSMSYISVDQRQCFNGHEGESFAFDNETPRHAVQVHAHQLGTRLVNNGEYLEFIKDSGYQTADWWLSEAWNVIQQQQWQRPIYWQEDLASEFSLSGVRPLDINAPVCHLSLYEADAFARWAGARLPTEIELECAAVGHSVEGNFYESGYLHPVASVENHPNNENQISSLNSGTHTKAGALESGASKNIDSTHQVEQANGVPGSTATNATVRQLFGDVWEWTSSSYGPYPGFKPLAGSLGEYNGKFMCSQHVLRGGSCVSPQSHLRATYRNFFYPDSRWQFSGLRLAKDIS